MNPQSQRLVRELQIFSGNRIERPEDLCLLLDLSAAADGTSSVMNELSFSAKFLHNTSRILTRIGSDATGYDALSREFGQVIEKVLLILRSLIQDAPESAQREFAERYLEMTPSSMKNLLSLMQDVSWYKNWLIDHRGEPAGDSETPP